MKKTIIAVIILIASITVFAAVKTYIFKPAKSQSALTGVYIDTDGRLAGETSSSVYYLEWLNRTWNQIADSTVSPTVTGYQLFYTDSPYYTINAFTGGQEGQEFRILCLGDSINFDVTGTNLKGFNRDIKLKTNESITFVKKDTLFYVISVSDSLNIQN